MLFCPFSHFLQSYYISKPLSFYRELEIGKQISNLIKINYVTVRYDFNPLATNPAEKSLSWGRTPWKSKNFEFLNDFDWRVSVWLVKLLQHTGASLLYTFPEIRFS